MGRSGTSVPTSRPSFESNGLSVPESFRFSLPLASGTVAADAADAEKPGSVELWTCLSGVSGPSLGAAGRLGAEMLASGSVRAISGFGPVCVAPGRPIGSRLEGPAKAPVTNLGSEFGGRSPSGCRDIGLRVGTGDFELWARLRRSGPADRVQTRGPRLGTCGKPTVRV